MRPRSERRGKASATRREAVAAGPRWFGRWTAPPTIVLIVAVLLVIAMLGFGGRVPVLSEPLPPHADVAIVLNGTYAAAEARREGALELLREGRVGHVMLSVGAVDYYGEWLPDLVRRFVAREYGDQLAERIVICEGLADSTVQEMEVLKACLRSTSWESAIVVTSNYHTRRTGMIVKATLRGETSVQRFTVHGVADGDFESSGWWRQRRYAKTWLLETTKLLWFLIERAVPGGAV